ncbi:hypothetical protein ACEPAG_5158 [Sanghuangporus baumii]
MSQARITLRPPPNVDFVEGYPGIPAGRDRPHAEVKGTIEVRLPDQNTKAKWVRIELVKFETLPGGGNHNVYMDHVGSSPVKVWAAEGEWDILAPQDFPFAIRIPESIPPSIQLDKGAGIRYELTATLCMKGKRNFFKPKDITLATSHQIIIDKHELHSTWPVYSQPESRHVVEDLLMLTVERSHTCYGPGDRVKVLATFKNDGIPAVALRTLEFLLKETIIYRPGTSTPGKKRAPQCHVMPIGEQREPVNMTVYQGQQYATELGCFIPQTHTNTTVVAARHIDIGYSIQVKALLATGKPLLIELPVTVSNWPRNMSIEAIRRIGIAPNLSLVAPIVNIGSTAPATIGTTRPAVQTQAAQQPGYNTAPVRSGLFPKNQVANERMASQAMSATSSQYGDPVIGPRSNYDEFGFSTAAGPSHSAVPRGASPAIAAEYSGTTTRRPTLNTNPSRRLTLANVEMEEDTDSPPSVQPSSPRQNELTVDDRSQSQNAGGSGSASHNHSPPPRTNASQRSAWPTAEEEKQRLFNYAREQALKTQASMGNTLSPMPATVPERVTRQDSLRTQPTSMPIPEPVQSVTKPEPKKNTPWPTAEEEKLRLYQEAQNAAFRTQTQGLSEEDLAGSSLVNGGSPPPEKTYSNGPPAITHKPNSLSQDGPVYPATIAQPTETKSTGAQLYQHALASMGKKPPTAQPVNPPSPPAPKPRKSHPTAEEEKAALRYWEAKRAVDRHQQVNAMNLEPSSPVLGEGPIAYDELYPVGVPAAQAGSSHMINGHGRRVSETSSRDHGAPPPPPISPPPASIYETAMSEKERLRRKYEAEDAVTNTNGGAAAPIPPARASGSRVSPPGYDSPPPPSSSRSQPLPPADYSGPRFLTAVEEKARLRAQMEAEDAAQGSGSIAGPSRPTAPPTRSPSLMSYAREPLEGGSTLPPPPPPPLAPRPPVEYIEQTLEEDLRSQAEQHAIIPAKPSSNVNGVSSLPASEVSSSGVDFGLPFRPFSPLDLGVNFDSLNRRAPSVLSPPPLPPKVPIPQ